MRQVLVVEDDPAVREIVTEFLGAEGYVVHEACNGAEALAHVREQRPDLIVPDLMMPVMDGWSFVEACRSSPWWGRVPIIVTSAAADLPGTAEQLRAIGVRACLPKPLDLDALLAVAEEQTLAAGR